ncbi:MAG: type I restriction endonuclease subunit R, partial [Oscillibacter sp.]|nr:type I restriction endonuclease subunit R [Oscillibacter sp.]
MSYTESHYENAILQLFQQMGYTYTYGPDIDRDYHDPLYEAALLPSLRRVNPALPPEAITEAVYKLQNFESGTLLQKNMVFMDYLQNGVSVKYFADGEERSALVYLIDYQNPANNDFTIANQWTVVENSEKRPDVVLFVNGLPLVVMELKSPSREETDASAAYRQLRNYMHEIPSLFVYNAVCVMSDLTVSKAGTITSSEDRFMEWKTKDGSYENTAYAQFDTFFEGIFEKTRFLDILRNFICFNVDGQNTFKILAGYHQYFAVKKAVDSTRHATDGKGGVFWHTQGSGKSLSMVFYAHYLQQALESPTIVVLTDRNDLDDQLYGQFARCKDFLRQVPQHARSRQHLRELLAGRQANGIIFTTMQKFEESGEALSLRRNIVVMADEAHRGQYGLTEKVVVKRKEDGELEARTVTGTARIIRDSLPNATYIGFTGTPISSQDRNTREVFGEYIDVYDMTQAVEDGATRPVYYESRVIHLKLDETTLRLIDTEYDLMAENADPYVIEKSKKELGQMEAILGAEQTIHSLVDDILDHYENYRAHLLTGKAMIVAYSRPIAMKIYKRILELRPAWTEKVGVVMTQGNNDPEEWRQIIGNKAHKDELARKFKDNSSPMKIAIVVDMWLTGFDVPSLATMYVYKPMAGHNLMQAIARVNRVFGDKEGGLVVDYVGIAAALKQA